LDLISPRGTVASGGGIGTGDDFFAELGSTSTWYANSTWPNGIYSSAMNKTIQAITDFTVVSSNPVKQVRLYGRDHAAGSWLSSVDLFTDDSNGTGTQPEADDHGVGALCEDHEGYIHAFGGVHNGAMKHVVSNSRRQCRQRSRLKRRSAPAMPIRILFASGSQINLFCRSFNGALQFNLVLRRTTALSAGAATWGSELPILSFGDNTRVYLGQSIAVGTDIYLVATQADFGDTLRKHVYILVYDTVTGNVRNLANTKTVLAASLPVGLSDADTFYRVVGFAGGEEGVTPSMAIENGRLHIGYIQGVDGAANVRHRYFDLATGAQQGGVNELGSTNNPRNTVTVTPGAAGIEARWTTNVGAASEYQTTALPAVAYASGGDMYGASWTIGGGWAASALVRAGTRAHKVDSPSAVFNAHSSIRWMYAERASDTVFALGGNLRSFAYGDAGIVKRDWGDEAEYTAWAARLGATPSAARKSRVNALIRGHKGCGAFALMDGMYIGANAASLADYAQNLKANVYNQTFSGTIALDGPRGPKGDGVSGYSEAPYNPVSSGGNLSGTSITAVSWLLTEGQSAGYDIGCGAAIASLRAQARSATDTRNGRAANSTVMTAAQTTALGETGIRRTVNTGSFVRDGAGANTTALTVPAGEVSPNGNMTFHKNASAFASRAHGLDFFGAYQPSDQYGVGYQVRKRFMIEEGLV
jgi:hypothetical protein